MTTPNILETIAADQTAAPVELPRLTVQETFKHYARIGQALERAGKAFAAIPDCATAQGCTDELKELVKECEAIAKTAARLLEANR